MAIPDQGMDLAGKQVDAGQQADCAVALIFMIAREGRVQAGLGGALALGCSIVRQQVGHNVSQRALVIRSDRAFLRWPAFAVSERGQRLDQMGFIASVTKSLRTTWAAAPNSPSRRRDRWPWRPSRANGTFGGGV
jgi:hypothetical protein